MHWTVGSKGTRLSMGEQGTTIDMLHRCWWSLQTCHSAWHDFRQVLPLLLVAYCKHLLLEYMQGEQASAVGVLLGES